jgi:hypothetical protein
MRWMDTRGNPLTITFLAGYRPNRGRPLRRFETSCACCSKVGPVRHREDKISYGRPLAPPPVTVMAGGIWSVFQTRSPLNTNSKKIPLIFLSGLHPDPDLEGRVKRPTIAFQRFCGTPLNLARSNLTPGIGPLPRRRRVGPPRDHTLHCSNVGSGPPAGVQPTRHHVAPLRSQPPRTLIPAPAHSP